MTRRRLFGLSLAPLFAPLLALWPGLKRDDVRLQPPVMVGKCEATPPALGAYWVEMVNVCWPRENPEDVTASVLINGVQIIVPQALGAITVTPEGGIVSDAAKLVRLAEAHGIQRMEKDWLMCQPAWPCWNLEEA